MAKTQPPTLRSMTADELINEIKDAEDEALGHHEQARTQRDDDLHAYHWRRAAAATVYAQLCREELQRRLPS